MDPTPAGDGPPGPGLFTGKEGEFVLYRLDDFAAEMMRDKEPLD